MNTSSQTKPSLPRRLAPPIVAALMVLLLVGEVGAQTTGEGAPGIADRGVDKEVQNFLAANNLPGATVAITRGGRLVWTKGYGKADLATNKAMQPWHRSYIGSVSKFLTGVGAMKLVEEGKLDLNAPLYGTGTALWGDNLADAPGVIVSDNGAMLQPAGDYFRAIVQGVNNLDPNFPPSASGSPSLLSVTLYRTVMERTLSWTSAAKVKHLLSHTSGLLRSDNVPGAAAHFQKSESDLTYGEVHLHGLMGGGGTPYEFAPGSNRQYSNHAFALLGFIMGNAARMSFLEFMEQSVLHPLGLHGVVPINVANGNLDATPYSGNGDIRPLDPSQPSRLRTATGGWTATARDLVRVMCSLDRKSNGHRVLSRASVTTMETPPVAAFSTQPIAWDSIDDNVLSKNGRIDGGTSLVRKYLPGSAHPSDEINVAIAINKWGAIPTALIETIAAAAAAADIADDFDLFHPMYRCYQPPPKRMAILDGTIELRDESPKAPSCARPASVTASIRTTTAGPVSYVVACTGSNRTWKRTTTAHETAPGTFIGIAVHPIQITQQGDVTCFLRKGEQFGFNDVIATHRRHYPCRTGDLTIPPPVPPPTQPEVPDFICSGGKVTGRPTRQVCACPAAQVARRVAANRFRCDVQFVCEGGKIVTKGRPPRASCQCPRGMTAQLVPAPSDPALRAAPGLTSVKGDTPDRYRCEPTVVACRGVVVRSNACVCRAGQKLRNGVCQTKQSVPAPRNVRQ